MPTDELPVSIETLDELAGLDVLPDSYRVRADVAIPDGYVDVRRCAWQDTGSPPAPPRDAMDARRLERTAGFAGAHPGRHAWAALAWRRVRRSRGDSRGTVSGLWLNTSGAASMTRSTAEMLPTKSGVSTSPAAPARSRPASTHR